MKAKTSNPGVLWLGYNSFMNENSGKSPWVVGLLIVIAIAEVIGLLSSGPVVSESSTTEFERMRSELRSEWEGIRELGERRAESLERIEMHLATFAPSPIEAVSEESAESPALEEQVVPESLTDLVSSLDALRMAFERESAETQQVLRDSSGGGDESMFAMRARQTEPNWSALELLELNWYADPEGANRSQHFLTPKDLLRIYGPPTTIFRPAGGMNFSYSRPKNTGDKTSWAFLLQDGFVTRFILKK